MFPSVLSQRRSTLADIECEILRWYNIRRPNLNSDHSRTLYWSRDFHSVTQWCFFLSHHPCNAGVLPAIMPRPMITGAFRSWFHWFSEKALADSELSSSTPRKIQIVSAMLLFPAAAPIHWFGRKIPGLRFSEVWIRYHPSVRHASLSCRCVYKLRFIDQTSTAFLVSTSGIRSLHFPQLTRRIRNSAL